MRTHAALVICLVAGLLVGGCPASTSQSTDAGAGRADAGRSDGGADGSSASIVDAASPDEILPPSVSDEMTARAKHLLEAIAHDNADLATDMIFPRDAYLAARDSADPGKAWDAKVTGAFHRSVHLFHKRTHGVEKAQFVAFELGRSVQQAVPKKRDWKRPLWRVKHSRLTFTVDGRTQRLEIAEMTGWHGAWYVTKLR